MPHVAAVGRDGEPLGGMTRAEDEFDDLNDLDDEDEGLI